jgi:hypothetical protein
MAATVAGRTQVEGLSGGKAWVTAAITLDNAYPTGGTLGITGLLGFSKILALVVLSSAGLIHEYLPATDALRSYYPTGGGTVPAAPAQPLVTAGATPVTSSAANGAAAITAGQAVEVANATDLSAKTINVLALGQ